MNPVKVLNKVQDEINQSQGYYAIQNRGRNLKYVADVFLEVIKGQLSGVELDEIKTVLNILDDEVFERTEADIESDREEDKELAEIIEW